MTIDSSSHGRRGSQKAGVNELRAVSLELRNRRGHVLPRGPGWPTDFATGEDARRSTGPAGVRSKLAAWEGKSARLTPTVRTTQVTADSPAWDWLPGERL